MANVEVRICDLCQCAIPKDSDRIMGLSGSIVINGQLTIFPPMDFCCTAHLISFINAQPVVATPNPPYGPPPTLP